MALIRATELKEGELFCKWLENRLLRNKKNVLGAELGATGSGKSYRDLRKFEIWYRDYLKREIPKENICFGVADILRRLNSGQLKPGDILIFEEAGANLGALDFQSKISKLFTYVLQSFRSKRIGIFFNLPYLSMLNKQARLLLHYSSESVGVDPSNKTNKAKLFFHQVNQGTGKIYKKFPRAKVGGQIVSIERVSYGMPSKELAEYYEKKKEEYLNASMQKYEKVIEEIETGKRPIKAPKEWEFEAWGLRKMQKSYREIGELLGKSTEAARQACKHCENFEIGVKNRKNPKGNAEIQAITQTS